MIVATAEKSADLEVCSLGVYSRSASDGKRSIQQIERLSEDPLGQTTNREWIGSPPAAFLQHKYLLYIVLRIDLFRAGIRKPV